MKMAVVQQIKTNIFMDMRSIHFITFIMIFICFIAVFFNVVIQYGTIIIQSNRQPILLCDAVSYNLGNIIVPEKVSHIFLLENIGQDYLSILNITPDCGACVEVTDFTKTPIPPGQSGTVTLTLLTQHLKGKVQKEALVKTNDPKNPNLILTLEAEVSRPETENATKNTKVTENIKELNTGTSNQSVSTIP
jgi:hypothetical protein